MHTRSGLLANLAWCM